MEDENKTTGLIALLGCLGVGLFQIGIFVGVIFVTVKLVKLFW